MSFISNTKRKFRKFKFGCKVMYVTILFMMLINSNVGRAFTKDIRYNMKHWKQFALYTYADTKMKLPDWITCYIRP